MVQVNTLKYNDKEYQIVDIPDVFSKSKRRLLIGSQSLNIALYDDEKGYHDKTAEEIDEKIYAYLDDHFFLREESEFLDKVQELLD